jgi:uncharacterized protein YciI
MHYLYRIQPARPAMLSDGPTEEEEEITTRHFEYLQDLTMRGVVKLAGRTLNVDESSFGIVILEVESEAVARDIMNDDPAVKDGVMRAELFPFRIALM